MPADQWTMVGVTGQQWRVEVSPWGAARRVDAEAPLLEWYVAADDRWHVPAAEPTLRQHRVDGAPVLETRVRIPDGDAVQRIWAVADHDGILLAEFENDSPLPMAIAVTGGRLLTSRPPSGVPAQGIDLPSDALVLPVGHRATVRVAVPVQAGVDLDPALLSPWDAVARGWRQLSDRASRLNVPDEKLGDAVVEARSDLLLHGPVTADDDPAGFLLDVAELVRLGDDADAWLPSLVPIAEKIARSPDGDTDRALMGLGRVARAAGDQRALGDVQRLRSRVNRDSSTNSGNSARAFTGIRRGDSVGRFVSDVESRLVHHGQVLPAGIPTSWLGVNFEVHGVPAGPESAVGFAVRWHGERPAVLWEQRGEAVELTAPIVDPDWSTRELSGEVLWPAPRSRTSLRVRVDDPGSFS